MISGAPQGRADLRELPGKLGAQPLGPQPLAPPHMNCVFLGSTGLEKLIHVTSQLLRRGRGRGPVEVPWGWREEFRDDGRTRRTGASVSLTRRASVLPWVQGAQGLCTPGDGSADGDADLAVTWAPPRTSPGPQLRFGAVMAPPLTNVAGGRTRSHAVAPCSVSALEKHTHPLTHSRSHTRSHPREHAHKRAPADACTRRHADGHAETPVPPGAPRVRREARSPVCFSRKSETP